MHETDQGTIAASLPFAEDVAAALKLPLLFTSVPRRLSNSLEIKNIYPVDTYVLAPWE
jgi:hypothetical protein